MVATEHHLPLLSAIDNLTHQTNTWMCSKSNCHKKHSFQRCQKELHAAMKKLEELDEATGLLAMLHSTSRVELEAAQVLYEHERLTSAPQVQAASLEEAHTMHPSM